MNVARATFWSQERAVDSVWVGTGGAEKAQGVTRKRNMKNNTTDTYKNGHYYMYMYDFDLTGCKNNHEFITMMIT